ncbi:MAG: hypothetical protein JST42_27990 [Bacteroidetes bacterium]|nr:hypothetical protein [Bacteroidota bacterium]
MKRSLYYFAFILTIGPAIALFSCKKHNDAAPKTCRIVTEYDTIYGFSNTGQAGMGTFAFEYEYDYKGRIVHMSTLPPDTDIISKVWTYGPHYMYVYPGAYQSSTDTIYQDDSSRVTKIVTYEPNDNITTTLFTYDAAGQLATKTQKTNSSNDQLVITYSWSDGDMISEKDNSGHTTTHSYFTDRPATAADPTVRNDLSRYGVSIIRNKHLIKSSDFGNGGYTNYNYTFDKDGRVATVTSASGAYFGKVAYVYDCSQ